MATAKQKVQTLRVLQKYVDELCRDLKDRDEKILKLHERNESLRALSNARARYIEILEADDTSNVDVLKMANEILTLIASRSGITNSTNRPPDFP